MADVEVDYASGGNYTRIPCECSCCLSVMPLCFNPLATGHRRAHCGCSCVYCLDRIIEGGYDQGVQAGVREGLSEALQIITDSWAYTWANRKNGPLVDRGELLRKIEKRLGGRG